jgi:RES domain-containing protein
VILYRIAAVGKTYGATDKSGKSASVAPGRWNAAGELVMYAAPTIAMAVLETAAHIMTRKGLPLNKFLVAVDIPDDLWSARMVITAATAPPGWDAIPAGQPSIDHGSKWYQLGISALMEVPSAIVPEESCVLINCQHPEVVARVAVKVLRKHTYEGLLGR